jgi:hypothetical protein
MAVCKGTKGRDKRCASALTEVVVFKRCGRALVRLIAAKSSDMASCSTAQAVALPSTNHPSAPEDAPILALPINSQITQPIDLPRFCDGIQSGHPKVTIQQGEKLDKARAYMKRNK